MCGAHPFAYMRNKLLLQAAGQPRGWKWIAAVHMQTPKINCAGSAAGGPETMPRPTTHPMQIPGTNTRRSQIFILGRAIRLKYLYMHKIDSDACTELPPWVTMGVTPIFVGCTLECVVVGELSLMRISQPINTFIYNMMQAATYYVDSTDRQCAL